MTAMITETDVDSTVLDELDFEPTCQVKIDTDDPCSKPARWVLFWVFCCPGRSGTQLCCDQHKEFVLTFAGPGYCYLCGRSFDPFRKCVERIDPINSGGGRG